MRQQGIRVNQSKTPDGASALVLLRKRIDAVLEHDRRGRPMWGKLARSFGKPKSGGYLMLVYNGKRTPSNWLLHALGLPPHTVSVEPLACGHAPLSKRCPICQPRTSRPRAWRPAARGVW